MDDQEEFVLAPGSPTQTVQQPRSGVIKTNGLNGSPGFHSYLSVPTHPDTLLPRPRSASPSLGGGQEGEEGEQAKSAKKRKKKSHFSMFRLHKHSKSKKYLKENELEAAMLSQSDGSSLLQQKLHQQRIHPNRRSFSGRPNRSMSPIGSSHSFQGFMESEGESEDEFLKTLMNPTNQMSIGPSPSPLLIRTPTPHQQNSSVESDGGHSGTGGPEANDGGSGGENQAAGDTVSLAPSHLDGSNPVSGVQVIEILQNYLSTSLMP